MLVRFRGVLGAVLVLMRAAVLVEVLLACGANATSAAAPREALGDWPVLVSAVFPDGYAPGDADEAVQIWNVGAVSVSLGGWRIDDGEASAAFPDGASIAAGEHLWLARDAAAFARSFGHAPDWAWAGAVDGAPAMVTTRGGPALANAGDEVRLHAAGGSLVDAVVYGRGRPGSGWAGVSVAAYHPGAIAGAHQVLYRKLEPDTSRPVPDTDGPSDWASDRADPVMGRRARFPGWDLESALRPAHVRATGRLEVAVAPDALFSFLRGHVRAAVRSIDVIVYTFEHPDLADLLVERLADGVRVRVAVDGDPAGGVTPDARWCLARIAAAGGEVFWMDDGGDVRARYRSAHAKLWVIDGRRVLVGSENPSLGAAPTDDQADGTSGRRGVYVMTEAPEALRWAQALFARDVDPVRHVDLRPFQVRDPRRGAPPPDFEPERTSGGMAYAPVAPIPLVITGTFPVQLISAPENALHPSDGLLGLLAAAGEGAEVRVAQLREPLWWGDGPTEGVVALNPRVAAYLAAARRGARVRVLLDGYFDDPAHWNANVTTVNALNARAHAERLDLEARVGNPAGRGLHNKMVLVSLPRPWPDASLWPGGTPPDASATHWAHVGSLNGTEVASKVNREVAVQVGSAAAHAYLAQVFDADWRCVAAHVAWLPRSVR